MLCRRQLCNGLVFLRRAFYKFGVWSKLFDILVPLPLVAVICSYLPLLSLIVMFVFTLGPET